MAPLNAFVRVASVGDLANGEIVAVTADGEDLILIRVGDEYFALDAICSHAYGILDQGTLRGYELECPIHMGRFDVRTGTATREPAEVPIATYAVRIEGDEILVGPTRE